MVHRPFERMVTFNITGFLTDFTGGERRITLPSSAATVAEALAELWTVHVGLRDRVLNEQGQVRLHVNVFLNDENIRQREGLKTALAEPCEITILPSVSGGS